MTHLTDARAPFFLSWSLSRPQLHHYGDTLEHNTYPQTFPPDKRLRVSSEFQNVFSQPQHRFRQAPLQVLAKPNARQCSRLGLVIPKKMLKKAVHRNRLKRLIRDQFRQWQGPVQHELVQHESVHYDLVIMLKQKIQPEILYATDMNNTIRDLFNRLDQYTIRHISRDNQAHCAANND